MHALLAAALHHFLDLMHLPFENQVGHQRRIQQDLDCSAAPAARLQRDQSLRQHCLQVQRKIHQQLVFPLFREKVDDPVQCLIGAVGV